MYLFVLISVLLLLLTFKYQNTIEGMGSTATECRQSVEDIQKAFESQKAEDETRYAAALQAWQAKKNGIVTNFQNNPTAWPTLCVNSNLCEPVSAFFQQYDNANLSGWGREETGGNSWEKCLSKCRDRSDCQWVNWTTGGTCFINTLGDRQGSEHGFKTDRGYIRYSNQYIDGYTLRGIDNQTPEQCQNLCSQDAGCHHWQVGNDRRCYLQNTGNQGGVKVGVKKPSVGLDVPDFHPLIVNQIGAPPKMERTQVPIQNIICQDCSQQINNTNVADSKDINFTQINQCIANMEAKEVAAKEEASKETVPPVTTPPTTPQTTPTTPQTTPQTTENDESRRKRIIAIVGGALSLVLCVIIIIIIIFVMKNGREIGNE